LLFKRPLFLIIAGKRKAEVSTQDSYESYRQRFDLEHFFRFGKNRLVMDKVQTPDTEHEEVFMQYMLLAAAQLYLARKLGVNLPKPWEKNLPEFKFQEEETDKEYSPTQTQRIQTEASITVLVWEGVEPFLIQKLLPTKIYQNTNGKERKNYI